MRKGHVTPDDSILKPAEAELALPVGPVVTENLVEILAGREAVVPARTTVQEIQKNRGSYIL